MIKSFLGKAPKIDPNTWVAEDANLIGDLEIGAYSSIFFQTTIRADVNYIRIGEYTNIQDGTVIHVNGRPSHPTLIGSNVTVGHSAVIHGCTIEDSAFVGMSATLLNGCVIQKHAMVAAGSLVKEGQVVESGTLVAGVPAKVIRPLKEEEIAFIDRQAKHYWNDIGKHFREDDSKT